MYEKGLFLFKKADKLKNVHLNELYNGLVKTKERIQQRLNELKQKTEIKDNIEVFFIKFLILMIN